MATKPVEIHVYEFLAATVAAATDADDTLHEIQVHDTVYQSIIDDDPANAPRGVRVSEASGHLGPEPGGVTEDAGFGLKEYNGDLQIVCFAKVQGPNQKDRGTALQQAFDIQQAVVAAIYDDETLGGRVCEVTIDKMPRGYDNLDGKVYAVALIPLTINPM